MTLDYSTLLATISDFVCGYPLFLTLIGGGLFLFITSRCISIRRLAYSLSTLSSRTQGSNGQISSLEALASVVAATVGMGNIAGVAIALVMGGPGAIFWMWVSALVGMCTKYYEGALAIMYKGVNSKGEPQGGTMHIIEQALGKRWKPLAVAFAVAGMFGTLCIMNANQVTEAVIATFTTPETVNSNALLAWIASTLGVTNDWALRFLFGLLMASIVGSVVLGGVKRIAYFATRLVPFMVGLYFLLVAYIIATNIGEIPTVIATIFTQAFSLKAGFGALVGVAIIGARRAALVNDAGVGTATIMHGASRNDNPVKEGLVAMLGPGIDSGLVCTLTAFAILLGGDINVEGVKGLEIALTAFDANIPAGKYLLMVVVLCFAFSSMFTYSYYGTRCASYIFGERYAHFYTYFFLISLIVFAIVPLSVAVSVCDLFYAFMAFPTMFTILKLRKRVNAVTRDYFASIKK